MSAYQYDSTDNYFYPESPSEFSYKDGGDTEKKLYTLVKNSTDKGVFSGELISGINDWPTYYHLTPLRANLLRPFQDKIKNGSTLELGAGCGAITRFIGELGGSVTALEGSFSRAKIIGNRCFDLPNVKVIADLIQNFQTNEKFDVVTLIGVLEYSRVYVKGEDPVQIILNTAKSFLKEDGIVILAIENKLGLKYLCGAREDHFGIPMIGINDSYSESTAVTFGLEELLGRCSKAGFQYSNTYVPVPDYKTPVSIIYPAGFEKDSRNVGWDLGSIISESVPHDWQNPENPTFSLEAASMVVANNGLGKDLANSFLIELSLAKTDFNKNILAAHYGGQRPKKFSKETQFCFDNKSIYIQSRFVADTINIQSQPWKRSEYITGVNWHSELIKVVNKPNWSMVEIAIWAKVWIDALISNATMRSEDSIPELGHYERFLPKNYIDATPFNLIIKNSVPIFFDLEWELSKAIPVEIIVFRGLLMSLRRVVSCAKPATDVPLKLIDLIKLIMKLNRQEIHSQDNELAIRILNAFQFQSADMSDNPTFDLISNWAGESIKVRKLFT